MAMSKVYSRINWENEPSENTPINENNLNKMDAALNEIDNRVVSQDTIKANKTEIENLVQEVSFDEDTGVFSFKKKNGSIYTLDTKMEKIAINFSFNKDTQKIILNLIDGTTQEIDLSALITQFEFLETETVSFLIGENGKVSAIVKEGSIEERHLRPDYLSDIKVEIAKAESIAKEAENNAILSKSYAVGESGARPEENTDNSKYYSDQSKNSSEISKSYLKLVEEAGKGAVDLINQALDIAAPKFVIDLATGHLMYSGSRFVFAVNSGNGHLEWGLAV